MNNTTPDPPIYDLFVGEVHVATLFDPHFEEMFWCSYRVEPTDLESDAVIHDENTWQNVDFVIKDKAGRQPNPHTFSGGFQDFCARKSKRLSFRSLFPPEKPRTSRVQAVTRWLKSIFGPS
jgi:hypothetical protein